MNSKKNGNMAVPESARAGQQLARLKDSHASSMFVTALAPNQPTGRDNAATARRRASVPPLVVTSQNRAHSKRQHDDLPRPAVAPELRRLASTNRSVQQSGTLPNTVEKTGERALSSTWQQRGLVGSRSGDEWEKMPLFSKDVCILYFRPWRKEKVTWEHRATRFKPNLSAQHVIACKSARLLLVLQLCRQSHGAVARWVGVPSAGRGA